MPVEAIPVVGAVVAAFVLFIVGVGGAALWTALPPSRSAARAVRRRALSGRGR